MANLKTITEGFVIKIQDTLGGVLPSRELNKDIIYIPENLALRKRAEATSGTRIPESKVIEKYKLDFISIWLESLEYSWERQRTSVARNGLISRYTDSSSKEKVIIHRAVPVDLLYSVVFWTKDKTLADDAIKEYMFLQQSNANVDMYYGDDDTSRRKLELDFFIRSQVRAEDSVANMFVDGKYWRPTFSFLVEGWFIKDIAVRTITEINLSVYGSFTQDVNTLVYEQTIDENT